MTDTDRDPEDALDALEAELEALRGEGGGGDAVPVSAAPETEEARAERLGAAARRAMADDGVRTAVGVMLALRQAYGWAYEEASRLLAALGGGSDPGEVAQVLNASVASAAAQPFDTGTLLHGLAGTVAPWLKACHDRMLAEEHDARRAAAEAAEAERRSRPVALHRGEHASLELARGETLVLCGEPGVTAWVIDRLVETALAGDLGRVVRLAASERPADGEPPEALLHVRVPPRRWSGCFNTKTSLPRVMGAHVFPKMPVPPDLVACDDLLLGLTSGLVGRRAQSLAADGQQRLSGWARDAGAAALAAFDPGADWPPNPPGAWDRLLAHARLGRVVGERVDGYYRVALEVFAPGLAAVSYRADFVAPAGQVDCRRPKLVLGGR